MKKKFIITAVVILVLVIGGFFTVRLGVGLVFDSYILDSALSLVSENEAESTNSLSDIGRAETTEDEAKPAGTLPDAGSEEITENETTSSHSGVDTDKPKNPKSQSQVVKETTTGNSSTSRLSDSEVISRVLKSSELTNKMASMVPYEDKRRIIQIVLSNFTTEELAEIAKNASKGLTSDYKSKMITEARSRITGEQWQQCLNIAYKYVEKIRPYVE